MIPLIKLNLLPYKEAQIEQKKKDFKTTMLLGAVIGIAVCVATYLLLGHKQEREQSRINFIQTGIDELDVKIKEIERLKAEKKKFLIRRQRVEELDKLRFEAAKFIDTLNNLVPEGLYITQIKSIDNSKSKGLGYDISGKAISDNKIAIFMNSIPSNGLFDTPELVKIEKSDDAQQFTIETHIIRKADEDTKNSK